MINSETDREKVSMWWESLPADQLVNVTVQGEMPEVDENLPLQEQQKLINGLIVIDRIITYIVHNQEAFPNIDPDYMNEQLRLGSIVMDITPAECEALSECKMVQMIYPNSEIED